MLRKIDPAVLLALLLPVFAIAPLVQQAGIPNLADGVIHVLRQVDFDRDLRDGALVPRWGADLYGGFGYPLYVFAPPLLAYGIELFHLAGLAMDDALKVCVALTLELYSLGMFLFMRPKVGSRGALLAAALNTYAPLRMREDVGQCTGPVAHECMLLLTAQECRAVQHDRRHGAGSPLPERQWVASLGVSHDGDVVRERVRHFL